MRNLATLPLFALVAACTVGPDYKGPPASLLETSSGASFVRAQDGTFSPTPGLARWWEALGDPTLNELVQEALAHNPDIDAAQARIREAGAVFRARQADRLPSLGARATLIHFDVPGLDIRGDDSSSSAIDLYSLGLNASWEIDLFGGRSRQLEQSRATFDVRRADLADVQVSLSAQVAQAYINLCGAQERSRLNARLIGLHEQGLALMRQRLDAGTATRQDVERRTQQLDRTKAEAQPLQSDVEVFRDQLAVLTGRPPGALDKRLSVAAPIPLPPARVEIGEPASLIAHRPDVRAAERTMAASSAAIGVRKAEGLPQLSFMGLLGLGGVSPSEVLDADRLTKLAMPSLKWSFLDFGRGANGVRQTEAQRDFAETQYRKSVLTALQDAESSLSRFGAARLQVASLVRAEQAATRSVAFNRQRVDAGTSTLVDQLDTEQQALLAAMELSQAKTALANSFVSVQKSLGLGWMDQRHE